MWGWIEDPDTTGTPAQGSADVVILGRMSVTLKALRQLKGLTIRSCAARCHITEFSWHEYESGRRKPSRAVRRKIEALMCLEPGHLDGAL